MKRENTKIGNEFDMPSNKYFTMDYYPSDSSPNCSYKYKG